MRLSRHEWVWVRGRVEMRGALVLIAAVAADFTRDLTIRLDVDERGTNMRWRERWNAGWASS